MNASEMTFGVEIETIAPASAIREHGLQIGAYPLHFGETEEGWYFASLAPEVPNAKCLKNHHACMMVRTPDGIKISSTELQPKLPLVAA